MLRQGGAVLRGSSEGSSWSLSLSPAFAPALCWHCPGCFICLFIFEVSSTRRYFISELKFQPLNMLQNQIKLQIILSLNWLSSVIAIQIGEKKHPNFSPLLWVPYLLCEIRMSVLPPVEPNKKKWIVQLHRIWHWLSKALGCVKK